MGAKDTRRWHRGSSDITGGQDDGRDAEVMSMGPQNLVNGEQHVLATSMAPQHLGMVSSTNVNENDNIDDE